MKKIKCTWVNSKLKEERQLILCVNDSNTVGDLLKKAVRLVKLSRKGSGKLRLLGIISHKIYIVFKEDLSIGALAKFERVTLRIEEIPCDEMNIAMDELLIPVGHYDKHPFSCHGVPFLLKVKKMEPFWEVKGKIKEKLEVSDEEFEKYEFALIVMAKPLPIQDNDRINSMDFSPTLGEVVGGRTWLGINHPKVNTLENKKPIVCSYLNNKFEERKIVLHLSTNGTVADLLKEAKKFVEFSENGSRKLRLLGVYGNKIQSIIEEDVSLEDLTKFGWKILRVEEIPYDEINLAKDEMLIGVAHYQKVVSDRFGVPFLIKVKFKEQFYTIRKRIQNKLQVSDEEFKKYKFSLLHFGNMHNLVGRTAFPNLSEFLNPSEKFLDTVWIGLDHDPNVNKIKCTWVSSELKVRELILQLNKNDTVSDLLEEAKKKVNLSQNGSGKLRLLDTSNQEIYSIIKEDMPIEALHNAGWRNLRVEEIPNDQINIEKDETLVTVVQYKQKFIHFGVPFLLKIKDNEEISKIGERIQDKLEIDDIRHKFRIELRSIGTLRMLKDKDRINISDFHQHLVSGEIFQRIVWIGVNRDYSVESVKNLKLKLFPCDWFDKKSNKKEKLLLYLREDDTVADLLDLAKEEMALFKNESKSYRRLRLLFSYENRLYYLANENMSLEALYAFGLDIYQGSLRIEEIPYDEEKEVLTPITKFWQIMEFMSPCKYSFFCTFVNDKLEYQEVMPLFLYETNTVADLLEEAMKHVKLSKYGSGKLRLIDTIEFENFSVLRACWPLQTLQATRFKMQCLRIEEIPNEEIKIAKDELLISVGHYEEEVSSTFGVPFLLKVKNKELFSEVKKRIQKKLQVPNQEFKTYKFALIVNGKPQPLQDTSCMNLSDFRTRFSPDGTPIPWTWLGIDHKMAPDECNYDLTKKFKKFLELMNIDP